MSNQIRPRGDITCIPTGEGWLYPAIVKGLCTGKRVGYAFPVLLIPRPPWKRWAGQSAASGGMNEPLPECQGFILLFPGVLHPFSGKDSRIKLCAISIHVSALSSRAQIAFKTANTFSKANLLTFS